MKSGLSQCHVVAVPGEEYRQARFRLTLCTYVNEVNVMTHQRRNCFVGLRRLTIIERFDSTKQENSTLRFGQWKTCRRSRKSINHSGLNSFSRFNWSNADSRNCS